MDQGELIDGRFEIERLAGAGGMGQVYAAIDRRTGDRVEILDFGVAWYGGALGASTRAGALLGTPMYMAPEQARGDERLDARADVFALGAVLFECLTGRAAFAAEHVMAVLARILLEE